MKTNSAPVMPGVNDPCWCGSGQKYKRCHKARDEQQKQPAQNQAQPITPGRVSPMRTVPEHIPRPEYAVSGRPTSRPLPPPMNQEQLARMKKSCAAAALVLESMGKLVRPGITTDEIDAATHAAYIAFGGFPSTLNYHGFPKSLCTSVNEVVCHGIPDDRALQDGDIVNLDVTIFLHGMHGDTNATFECGKVDELSKKLIRVTKECLDLGIAAVKPGRRFRDVGRAIAEHAHRYGFGVVRKYAGHGIGEIFHAPIYVPHWDDPDASHVIEPGMIFTIEPMLNLGTDDVREWDDGWTVVTADGKRSAQFEHTVHVTESGAEVLTVPDRSKL
ncbi:MAG: type I methionyl aminopeptidase [Deltaproteobacteria bacterium]|nr:type I methionyl aminopeptidase [Deltaproteobacteria bacterium]